MRDIWYADNRDLVKWSVLVHLAKLNHCGRILQIAYYRESSFAQVDIDGEKHEIPSEVKSHFRNIHKIRELNGDIKIDVLGAMFEDRENYLKEIKNFISGYPKEACIAFLDPDTGLEPANPSLNHVLNKEAEEIWRALKPGDVFIFYQHQTNRKGQPWVEPKKAQLADAIQMPVNNIKVARSFGIARDVVFFYIIKA